MNELEIRKKLLIAESELNRALLNTESRLLAEKVHALTQHAKHIGMAASIMGLITAGFSAFKRNATPSPTPKRTWISTMLDGARLANSFWPFFRANNTNHKS